MGNLSTQVARSYALLLVYMHGQYLPICHMYAIEVNYYLQVVNVYYEDHKEGDVEVVHPITSHTDTQCSGFCYWCSLCQAHQ